MGGQWAGAGGGGRGGGGWGGGGAGGGCAGGWEGRLNSRLLANCGVVIIPNFACTRMALDAAPRMEERKSARAGADLRCAARGG